MSWTPKGAVAMDAIAVGMQAMLNDLGAEDLAGLLSRAEELLESDDPIFLAITNFATDWEICRADADRLRAIGETLRDAVSRALRPDPFDGARVDIYG